MFAVERWKTLRSTLQSTFHLKHTVNDLVIDPNCTMVMFWNDDWDVNFGVFMISAWAERIPEDLGEDFSAMTELVSVSLKWFDWFCLWTEMAGSICNPFQSKVIPLWSLLHTYKAWALSWYGPIFLSCSADKNFKYYLIDGQAKLKIKWIYYNRNLANGRIIWR